MNRRDFLASLAIPATLLGAKELACDVAIIGGGVGGCAAALGALRNGMRVVMTEETDWIGASSPRRPCRPTSIRGSRCSAPPQPIEPTARASATSTGGIIR